MYAVVLTGGKQYKAEVKQTLKVEKLDAEVGAKVTLPALMIADGENILTGEAAKSAKVECEVVEQDKDAKIVVFKYKAKKNERKKQGHRQPYTKLLVLSIKK